MKMWTKLEGWGERGQDFKNINVGPKIFWLLGLQPSYLTVGFWILDFGFGETNEWRRVRFSKRKCEGWDVFFLLPLWMKELRKQGNFGPFVGAICLTYSLPLPNKKTIFIFPLWLRETNSSMFIWIPSFDCIHSLSHIFIIT